MAHWNGHNIEPITSDYGVMKWGNIWHVMTLESPAQIGSGFQTKQAAMAYAFYRQEHN